VKPISKVLTSRLQNQIQSLVALDQTGFIKGRSISENFILATELVQCCYKRKILTLVIKLDFVKVYDSELAEPHGDYGVSRVLEKMVLVDQVTSQDVHVSILVNGVPGPWITCKRGL